jgi:hypothetical protein
MFAFIVLSCLHNIFFQSTDDLYLYNNSLTGTIPSQIELLTSLSKCQPSVVCVCVVFDASHSNNAGHLYHAFYRFLVST